MYLIDAKVTLYNWPNPADALPSQPLDFWDPSSDFYNPFPYHSNPILGVDVTAAGDVIGLDTLFLGGIASLNAPTAPEFLFLRFSSWPANPANPENEEAGASLTGASCELNVDEQLVCVPDPGVQSFVGAVTYTPEPGTLMLLLAALGAGWVARRRAAV
jgi:hypothetical protein